MSTKATTKLLNDIIDRLSKAIQTTNVCKIMLAKELLWARNVVNWKLTKYRSWSNFVAQELTLAKSTVDRYLFIARLAEKFKYSSNDLAAITKAIGWTKMSYGMFRQNRRISVKGFISKYKNIKNNGNSSSYPDSSPGDRAYLFSLPEEIADVFDLHLMEHGMRQTAHRRYNVRKAVINLIKNKLL